MDNIRKIIKETIIDVITDVIVQEVIQRLKERSKKAIVIFSGGALGFSDCIDSINRLIKEDWHISVVLSKEANVVLTEETIVSLLDVDNVYVEGRDCNLYDLYQEANIVIVPILTVNSAAKVANCIRDTFLTNIISESIMMDKPVICAVNSCCPMNKERLQLNKRSIRKNYSDKMTKNLEALKNYGIALIDAKDIDKKTKKIANELFYNNRAIERIDKKIITVSDIANIQNKSKVNIAKDTIITELAKEMISKKQIEISR